MIINLSNLLYIIALSMTIFALVMYAKVIINKGFIDKSDLSKEVIIDKKK